MDNSSLIKLCSNGDTTAMELLYKSYSKQMMRIVCHYITDWDVARDLLHDGFLIIFSRIEKLREPSKLEYWMAAIMKNLALQYLKEQDVTLLLSADYDIPDVPEFEESITMEELEAMITRLPKGYQKVFRLAVLEHKTHKEIGRLLGISESTSGSQLFHARAMIRKMIIEHKIELGFMVLVAALLLGIFAGRDAGDKSGTYVVQNTAVNQEINVVDSPGESNPEIDVCEANQPMPATTSYPSSPIAEYIACERPLTEISTDSVQKDVHQAYADTRSGNNLNNDTSYSDSLPLLPPMDTWLVAEHTPSLSYPKEPTRHSGPVISLSGSYLSSTRDKENEFNNSAWAPGFSAALTSEYETKHMVPVTICATVSIPLSQVFSVESGVQYSLLQTRCTSEIWTRKIQVQYLGIPAGIKAKITDMGNASVYGSAGVAVDFPLSGKMHQTGFHAPAKKETFTPPVQFSTSVGIGFEYYLWRHIGIFAEPSVSYYFKVHSPYPTIRQDHPFEVSVPIGVRYKW